MLGTDLWGETARAWAERGGIGRSSDLRRSIHLTGDSQVTLGARHRSWCRGPSGGHATVPFHRDLSLSFWIWTHSDRPQEPFNGGTDLRSCFCPTAFRNQELSPFNLPNILTCKASNFFPIFIVLKTLDASYNWCRNLIYLILFLKKKKIPCYLINDVDR